MNDIKVIKLSTYVKPVIVERISEQWVLNGKKNYFYQYIIDRFNGSVTNAAILNSYNDLCYGRGLGKKNANFDDWVKLASILNPKDLKNIINDFNLFGEASFQVIKNKGGNLNKIAHVAKQKVVPNKENEDGEIDTYWYSNNWADVNRNTPEPFSAFGTSKDAIEIYRIAPYKAGKNYFPDPDYLAALQYCEMEEEIANLNINAIQKGLSAGYVINVPNGNALTEEEKEHFEQQIKAKLTGSPNAMEFVLSFNGVDAEITVTPFPVNEQIHKQWSFLTEEARQQIITGHRLTSPVLAGINTASGFSSTADEMDMAESQLMKRVIQPKQNHIINALDEVLEAYDINLDLYFIPLTEEKTQSNTALSAHAEDEMFSILDSYALDTPEGFELASDEDLKQFNFAATSKSEQDTDVWKIRYAYTKGTSKTPVGESRAFCNRMMQLSKQGKVFRKEDIEKMGSDGVNGKFAHTGNKYSIWLYAGGVNCYHRWERRIFKKKKQENGELYGGNPMQNVTEVNVNEARRQGAKLPKNNRDVAIAEIDKPNKGSLK